MTAFWTKAIVSGLIVALAATIARRQPALGSLIVSLPLVSVLSMIWLWRDGAQSEALARYIQGTFWFFLRRCRCSSSFPLSCGAASHSGPRLVLDVW